MNKIEKFAENLKEVNSIFKENDCSFWLAYGTLLGYVREDGFIQHTNDIDIGVFFKDFNKNIIYDMIQDGWELIHIIGYPFDSMLISWRKRGERMDMHFFYDANDSQVYTSNLGMIFTKKNTPLFIKRYDYYHKKFDLKSVSFLDTPFFVPENPEFYLEEIYGSNWRMPIEKWDYTSDPVNIVDTGLIIDKNIQRKQTRDWFKI